MPRLVAFFERLGLIVIGLSHSRAVRLQRTLALHKLGTPPVTGGHGRMQSLSRWIYGPSKEERMRDVQRRLRQEQRGLDREVRQIEQAVAKVKADIKRLARNGDRKSATLLAREVVRSMKHRSRLITSKAQLNSIGLQLQQQMSACDNIPCLTQLYTR